MTHQKKTHKNLEIVPWCHLTYGIRAIIKFFHHVRVNHINWMNHFISSIAQIAWKHTWIFYKVLEQKSISNNYNHHLCQESFPYTFSNCMKNFPLQTPVVYVSRYTQNYRSTKPCTTKSVHQNNKICTTISIQSKSAQRNNSFSVFRISLYDYKVKTDNAII